MKMNNKHYHQLDQVGMVSVLVTMILMIIITLVVTSFAVIVRREQRQSLDRQLSTQAFYAAETGVQNAASWLRNQITATGTSDIEVTTCNGFDYSDFNGGEIEIGIKYTCVLIDGSPQVLDYGNVEAGGSILIPINTTNILSDGIRVSWENVQSTVPSPYVTSSGHNLPQNTGLPTALVEATLIEDFNGGTKNRQALINAAQTGFFYPQAGSANGYGSFPYSVNANQSRQSQGDFINGSCNDSSRNEFAYACSVRITGLTQTGYFLRLKPLYQDTKFRISGLRSGVPQELHNAQALIDVTGKASDVMRRLQVRVPVGGDTSKTIYDNFTPQAAIETTDGICKRLIVTANIVDQCTP